MTRTLSAASIALAALVAVVPPAAADPAIEARIDALIARMTLAEKIGQLTVESHGPFGTRERIATGEIGNVINYANAGETTDVQAEAAKSRLGIPLLTGLDVLHGYRTLFMVPLGQAASFDPDLNRRAAEAIARETTLQGVNWTYAPMVDIGRDPRWGRVVEGAGEDPWLASRMAAARVTGYRAGGLVVTPKHFVGYGAPAAGLDYAPADMSEATLRDVYLPPFRAAVEAGAEAIMPALSALNGIPASVDGRLLTGVLRGEWGFRGFVVSDWGAIDQLGNHGIDPDRAVMARKTFAAGIDMDMASGTYRTRFAEEVAAGQVSEAAIDAAVRRVLRVKFEAGLDTRKPIPWKEAEAGMLAPATRELAVEVARRSIVMLENRRETLPIEGRRKVLLVGALADIAREHVGPHAAQYREQDVVTIRRALAERAARAGMAFDFQPGCDAFCTDERGFGAAVRAARAADVIVAVLGEPGDIAGEAASRADPNLPGRQQALLERLVATGKPVVLVIMAGRPLIVPWVAEHVSALLTTWYPGTYGSRALAEILFGDTAPSGRLPMTWPRHPGQIPISYDRLRSGRPAERDQKFTSKYVDVDWTPQFAFGHGLSTTRFAYDGLRLDRTEVGTDGRLTATVTVTNTGRRAGREVVQLYVRDVQASRVRPDRQLKGVASVDLAPGEAKPVSIPIDVADLGFHDETGTYRVEAGRFEIFVGGSSEASLSVAFTATGPDLVRPPASR
ncbi:glycoside hydrolase family 3 N-terminal domain-containing protein [Prosthecodimorpha staleyi]|nr:glycoside hydrolase family 3 N-terminal domain-containing protein [Prosthecodimorpha staleyi]